METVLSLENLRTLVYPQTIFFFFLQWVDFFLCTRELKCTGMLVFHLGSHLLIVISRVKSWQTCKIKRIQESFFFFCEVLTQQGQANCLTQTSRVSFMWWEFACAYGWVRHRNLGRYCYGRMYSSGLCWEGARGFSAPWKISLPIWALLSTLTC